MEKGDLLTLAGGVLLVLIIALLMHPEYLEGITSPPPSRLPEVTTAPVPTTIVVPVIPSTAVPTMIPAPEPTSAPPYRILYASDPFTYPVFRMPENTRTFGAGDLSLRGREMVKFAYISEVRGGITRKFSVPYPLWIINTTVTANRTPQYGNFRMVLCYAANGTIIDGEEILNRGSMSRIIETSGAEMYMIITTAYIDSFTVYLETPREYYAMYPRG